MQSGSSSDAPPASVQVQVSGLPWNIEAGMVGEIFSKYAVITVCQIHKSLMGGTTAVLGVNSTPVAEGLVNMLNDKIPFGLTSPVKMSIVYSESQPSRPFRSDQQRGRADQQRESADQRREREKRKPCLFWQQHGHCQRGQDCHFFHEDKPDAGPAKKTRMCALWKIGACTKGNKCPWPHSEDDRDPSGTFTKQFVDVSPRPGDWYCRQCRGLVFAKYTECGRCGAAKVRPVMGKDRRALTEWPESDDRGGAVQPTTVQESLAGTQARTQELVTDEHLQEQMIQQQIELMKQQQAIQQQREAQMQEQMMQILQMTQQQVMSAGSATSPIDDQNPTRDVPQPQETVEEKKMKDQAFSRMQAEKKKKDEEFNRLQAMIAEARSVIK